MSGDRGLLCQVTLLWNSLVALPSTFPSVLLSRHPCLDFLAFLSSPRGLRALLASLSALTLCSPINT